MKKSAPKQPPDVQAFRASLFDFIGNPDFSSTQSYRYFEDGLLVINNGLIEMMGDYSSMVRTLPDNTPIEDYTGYLIMPGLIDTHVHYPQIDMIASHGAQLLDWLERYTFPTELRFDDPEIADETARFFVQELLRNGTTTAMVFATIHPQSVNAVFNAANEQQMCLISGKVMMDRNAPNDLCDNAQSSYDDSLELIHKWHHQERLFYAVTPRFAPTSSEPQLRVAQQLVNDFPDVYLQSHVAENKGEVEWVKSLFPWSRSYLDVYDHFGLLGDRSVYAHCIYLNEDDRIRLAASGTAISFCPTSNLFLGSGLFSMQASMDHRILLGLGTDVGGGTSFNLLRTMSEGYKVCQMKGYNQSPLQAFYLATLGGAQSLYLDNKLGNFATGKEADFIVIDPGPTPLMQRRMKNAENLEDRLFALMMLGDDRNIVATHILGKCRYQREK